MAWITDPKTKEKSVTLTFSTVSFIVFIVGNILQIAGVVENLASLNEAFFGSLLLYLGRRMKIPGKVEQSA